MNDTTLLLVGHGSRGREGNKETINFAAQWRERHPDWRIEVCFIEHAEVLLDEGLDRAARGARQVLVLPFILNAAGHVKMDLPEALARVRPRHPAVEFLLLPHLGMGPEIQRILQGQLNLRMRELAHPAPQTTGVILLGRGSSDAEANGELARMARCLYESNDHELVDLAFTGVTWPRLETVVQRQVRLGMMQIVILPVYLFDGVLIERIEQQVARLRGQYPEIAFALGERFGFDEGIYQLLDTKTACFGQEAASRAHSHAHPHPHV